MTSIRKAKKRYKLYQQGWSLEFGKSKKITVATVRRTRFALPPNLLLGNLHTRVCFYPIRIRYEHGVVDFDRMWKNRNVGVWDRKVAEQQINIFLRYERRAGRENVLGDL